MKKKRNYTLSGEEGRTIVQQTRKPFVVDCEMTANPVYTSSSECPIATTNNPAYGIRNTSQTDGHGGTYEKIPEFLLPNHDT